jgi:hypothetical protein
MVAVKNEDMTTSPLAAALKRPTPERQRAGNADGRPLRQGLRLVAEKKLVRLTRQQLRIAAIGRGPPAAVLRATGSSADVPSPGMISTAHRVADDWCYLLAPLRRIGAQFPVYVRG